MPRPRPRPLVTGLAAVLLLLLTTPALRAQGTAGPSSRDSSVGYIDSAVPGNQLRLRFDAGYDNRRPNLAEFFWAQGQPLGPGVPRPESRVDYQELTAFVEGAFAERFSGFVELPWRFVNPDVNANTNGLSDMNAGFKWAFVYGEDVVATFQFRTYFPTGDASRGLGTRHVSLEPAFLLYKPLTDRLRFEGEFRTWVPVGGTDFAGDILRYGAGLNYDLAEMNELKVVPVAELVGWTALGGKQTVVHPSGLATVESAAGDTMLHIKLGVYLKLGSCCDFYTGYGRPLTGNRWYENTVRVQFRWLF